MENAAQTPQSPQPDQIKHFPVGGKLQHLFTKTLTEDDMWGLALVEDSNACQTLPKPLLNMIVRRGLEVEVYTPNGTIWVTLEYNQRANDGFNLHKIGWLEVAFKNGFKVGDTIHCWSLYHEEVGPMGILSLLFQKVAEEGAGHQAGTADVNDGGNDLF